MCIHHQEELQRINRHLILIKVSIVGTIVHEDAVDKMSGPLVSRFQVLNPDTAGEMVNDLTGGHDKLLFNCC